MKKIIVTIITLAGAVLAACNEPEPGGGSDDNGGTDDSGVVTEEQMPDPEETCTVSLYKNDNHSIIKASYETFSFFNPPHLLGLFVSK